MTSKIKYSFITAVHHMQVPENLGRGVHISDNLFLSNDHDLLANLLPKGALPVIGDLEVEALRRSKLFIHGQVEADIDLSHHTDADSLRRLGGYLRECNGFFNVLWLIRDNSANCEQGFLLENSPDRGLAIHSNAIILRYTKADQSVSEVCFSKKEIQAMRDAESAVTQKLNLRFTPELEMEVLSKHGRLSRASFLQQAARGADSLLIRIVHYCTCFECLFGTDSAELSHKLAERVAVFLGTSATERSELYRKIKRAYSIRSKVVHGAGVKGDLAELKVISSDCDDILRRILLRNISDPEARALFKGTAEELDAYFLERLLS